jgi:hypothetical protein
MDMTRVFIPRVSGGVLSLVLTAAWLLAASAPAAAGEIYSWRTEDGGYSFTDDPVAIPVRYREQIETRESAGLSGYARYTAQNEAATADYAERLAERVERLRLRGDALGETETGRAVPAPDYVTLRTGSRDASGVDIAVPSWAGDEEEPLVVETVFMRLEGSNVIQRVQVTRRGDEIVAINKPRARNWNISDPIDEAYLLEELQK